VDRRSCPQTVKSKNKEKKMKKMFAFFAVCCLASIVNAVSFTDANYKNGALTVPVIYTGMLKVTGWEDDGLCYNWEQGKGSYPLFLGLCQPCLDCVPCDIDMRHLASTFQNGDNSDMVANAIPAAAAANVDQTEAFFNRARLYIVTDLDTKFKTGTVKVVDLIDAYWGKDNQAATPTFFQFFNTVDSKGRKNSNAAYGRVAVMYQSPIYSRDMLIGDYSVNEFNGSTNGHTQNIAGEGCAANRIEDGAGFVGLIGVKDYKAFFKVDGKAYPMVTIKTISGDLFAKQFNFTDNNVEDAYKPQYVCRKGEDYILYKNTASVPENSNTAYDGRGAWFLTGAVTLRRNDAITKRMMADLNSSTTSVTCIPCNQTVDAPVCREYLDAGIVAYLLNRQYGAYAMTYIVDLDNDGIYGETAACGGTVEKFDNGAAYIGALVNTSEANDATANLYNLPAESANLSGLKD